MAARSLVRLLTKASSLRSSQHISNVRLFHHQNVTKKGYKFSLVATVIGGGVYYAYKLWREDQSLVPVVLAARAEGKGGIRKTYRQVRFDQFASVEYDGTIYMTPQDFLESITEESPRPRIGRVKLSPQELDSWLRHTPRLHRGNDHLFRNLHSKGIISYTEYLFLLCVLTKPHSGFRIAFNMFDTDGNQIVDKREFLVLENFFILPKHERKFVPRDQQKLQKILDELGREVPDTTLLVHFFGPKGNQVLNYADFHKFMSNLQREVIELEFLEFSRGMSAISEVDFARILLRYTNLDQGQVEECLERVRTRIPQEQGISLEDFRQFCQFLNSLDDFALTIKMYTFSQKSVSQKDFQRAVKVCTGYTLGPHVVNTVFQIFDSDNDGHLSHQEFINIMKDRLHRGARSHLMHTQHSWDAFRSCVRSEMRSL